MILIVSLACSRDKTRFDVDLSGVSIPEVSIQRYGQTLFGLDKGNLKEELSQIQSSFIPFLEGDLEQHENVEKIRNFIEDTLLIKVFDDCLIHFPNLSWLESDLSQVFRYYRYHFPDSPIPHVYTYISGFDYQHPVYLYNNNLLIALDMYLGEDYSYYRQLGLPAYVLTSFNRRYILRDCAEQLADREIYDLASDYHLLGRMIGEGKRLWFIKSMIPALSEEILLDYPTAKMNWARRNEGMVWAFLIENELLYSTQTIDFQKFINHAPFTSFFGHESPPRLGWWIGYRIVDAYMNKNREISLIELLEESDSRKILNESGYKPLL
ncbi:MAG: hypothetical protein ACNA7V_12420 [Bacteroidales bacterium]